MRSGPEYDYWLKDRAGALTVPASSEASWLLLRLTDKGVLVAADGRDIVATPASALTADEREAIRALKPALLQLLAYAAPVM